MPRPGPAFSNGTEHEIWAYNWCDRCLVDAPYRNGLGAGCPLMLTVVLGEIPDEWIETETEPKYAHDYRCLNFRPPGWRNPEPEPKPEPPQDGLFPRPERKVRMLRATADPAPAPTLTHGHETGPARVHVPPEAS